jgi:hypothetical protein
MNDNEIVLSLLEFYKRKGIDMYKVLDDPSFKALSLDTKLKAIKTHAQELAEDTGHGITKKDFKGTLSNMFAQAVKGAITGVATGVAAKSMFRGGHLPLLEVGLGGAVVGAMAGAASSAVNVINASQERAFMRHELNRVVSSPTSPNALGVLSAGNLKGMATSGEFNKILAKVRDDLDGKLGDHQKSHLSNYVIAHNEALGRERLDELNP